MGTILSILFYFPPQIGLYFKRKEFATKRSKFFPFLSRPFSEGASCLQESKQEVTEVVSLWIQLINLRYRLYPKFTSLTPYLILFFSKSILLHMNVCKIAEWQANSVYTDQMLQNVASDQGLHCLLWPLFLNTQKYGNLIKSNPLRNHPGSPITRLDKSLNCLIKSPHPN